MRIRRICLLFAILLAGGCTSATHSGAKPATTPSASPSSQSPASRLFALGGDLCLVIDPGVVNRAAGGGLGAGVWDGRSCTWETADQSADHAKRVIINVNPGLTLDGLQAAAAFTKHSGVPESDVRVPGALGAYLVTLDLSGLNGSSAGTGTITNAAGPEINQNLTAVYPLGGIYVSLAGPKVTSAQVIALMAELMA